MCLLQGYRRCTVKKPKTSTTIARRNSCHEGKNLRGVVHVCLSMSPVSCILCMCVWCYLLNITVSWLRLVCVDLFGEECSTTFRKLDLFTLFYVVY